MSSSIVNPIANPTAWDFYTIAGQSSPGLSIVGAAKRSDKWDVKEGKGTVGASTTFVNRPPATFSILTQLWEERHFSEWAVFKAALKYDPKKKTKQALSIYHPALADIEIGAVVCTDVTAIEHKGNGLYEVSATFLEYYPSPPTNMSSTPNGSTGNSKDATGKPPGLPPDPVGDDLEKQIAAEKKKAKDGSLF